METLYFERILVILSLVSSVWMSRILEIKEDHYKESEAMCQKLGQNPYFEPHMVVGKPWRIYHSWNMDLGHKCMDMRFKHAATLTINRIYNDMNEYLSQQPAWSEAELYLTMGKSNHEMLLFDDQGPAGRFQAVPNVVRDGNLLSPHRQAVPLLKFQLKLIRGSKFLVMLDCKIGVASLAARADEHPPRKEINAAAAELDLGDEGGTPACLNDRNQNDKFVIPYSKLL